MMTWISDPFRNRQLRTIQQTAAFLKFLGAHLAKPMDKQVSIYRKKEQC